MAERVALDRQRPEHIPMGNPCVRCRLPALSHRVEHVFSGRIDQKCKRCGLPYDNHKSNRAPDTRVRSHRVYARRPPSPPLYFGVDGEGQGRKKHIYTFLAAADEAGEHTHFVENREGLSTRECLHFLYGLPKRARLFGYSLGYDVTKILQSLTETPDGRRALWFLLRPERRQRFGPEARKGPYPVLWQGWSLNLQGSKFSFRRTGLKQPGRRRILWDIFKFYQSKFVTALEDWKVGTEEERALILEMKENRAFFDRLPPERVKEYCFLECRKMAEQVRKLIEAHEAAGLELNTFYGAGSTAKCILKKIGIKEHLQPAPEEMRDAVARAFSAGRFELNRIGVVKELVHGWDISSAYPYQMCSLPCLTHGRWEHVSKRAALQRARWALVRYSLPVSHSGGSDSRKKQSQRGEQSWGPFPFRMSKGMKGPTGVNEAGSICYPRSSGGGWVYLPEYLAGEKYFPNVTFEEAWVYRSECECMPFQKIPLYYAERCKIGKEGPGIVLKLGINAGYGSLAQSVGKGEFNSWVWAGMITSGCRAQVLELIGLHRNRDNLLMIATDGILTLEKIQPPEPIDTGTFHVSECKAHKRTCSECPTEQQTKKPLGGWEYKAEKRGMFLARPGVYFPLDPSEKDLRVLRGRGIGRRALLDHWPQIVEAWEQRKPGVWPTVSLSNISRFCGAKTSSHRVLRGGEWVYRVARGNHLPHEITVKGKKEIHPGKPHYGEWIERKVEMSFDPLPKRIGMPDGSLALRDLPPEIMSAPYDRAVLSEEAKELMALAEMLTEQPHADFDVYGGVE